MARIARMMKNKGKMPPPDAADEMNKSDKQMNSTYDRAEDKSAAFQIQKAQGQKPSIAAMIKQAGKKSK